MTSTVPRWRVTSTLGITQTLAWGSTYYLPAVFADPISAELGLPQSWFFGMFSAALLLSGLLGPIAGRLIDRHGGRDVLAATNVVFASGLVLLGLSSGSFGLALAWGVIGVGMGFGLYEAAFATVAGLYGRDARNAITGITLFAGFASTVGWPLSAFFIHSIGWRDGCFAWAALHLLVGLPLNRLLVLKAVPVVTHGQVSQTTPDERGVSWIMVALAFVFGTSWFVSTAFAAHMPRLLTELGATPAVAVMAGALIGPAQVAARIAEFGLLLRGSPMMSARLATALHPIGAAVLVLTGAPGAIAFALLHGAGNGIMTIARGTLPLALFGPAGYGLRTGLMAAPARILQGAAPVTFGLVLDTKGPTVALLCSGSLMGLCLLTLSVIRQQGAEPGSRDHNL